MYIKFDITQGLPVFWYKGYILFASAFQLAKHSLSYNFTQEFSELQLCLLLVVSYDFL